MTACWCRLIQPEKRRRKKASGEAAGPWPKRVQGAAPVQGGRGWGIVGPQIGPRFPRHEPPRRRRPAYFRTSVLGRVFAPHDHCHGSKGSGRYAIGVVHFGSDRELVHNPDPVDRFTIVVAQRQAIRTPRPSHSGRLVRQGLLSTPATRDTDCLVVVAPFGRIGRVRGVESLLHGHRGQS